MEHQSDHNGNKLCAVAVKSSLPVCCPYCHLSIDRLVLRDGDTVDIDRIVPQDFAFDLNVIYGSCEHCRALLTLLQISHLCRPQDGYYWINLNDYSSEAHQLYDVTGSPFNWSIEYYTNVTGLFFTAATTDIKPRDFTSQDIFPWISIHFIGPDAFAGHDHTMDRAREIFQELRPGIMALDQNIQEVRHGS